VLTRTGTVTPNDFLGTGTVVLADGSEHPSRRFFLHEVQVGNHVVRNVIANVVSVRGDPLLGQSFVSKLPAFSIDNQQHTLVLNDSGSIGPQPITRPQRDEQTAVMPPSPDSSSTLSVGTAAYDRGDYSTALLSFQPSAQAGDGYAQYYLGVMYLKGQGVPRNPQLALEWLAKAASAGAAGAQAYMGAFNRRGDLVPQNYAEAMRWYLLAAKQNHENSQYRIALMYYQGEGVQQDLREAYKWAVIASVGGEPEPNQLRMKLEKALPASGITEGQRKAALWRSENILPK